MVAAYHEYRPPAGLEPLVACLWENTAVQHRLQRIVPDGCIDLVWMGEPGLHVAGADTGPRMSGPVGTPVSGIRLRPGAAGAVLGLPASEVLDQQVPLELLWPDLDGRVGEVLAEADTGQRLRIMTELVLRRRTAPDRLVMAATHRLSEPGARVATVAADLGVGVRRLHRQTVAAVGYGPKTLARVARLRRLIASPDEPLAVRAVTAGYASQAHMSDEVRRLTGTTPVRFLADARLTTA
jgi:AraC-like DNA-binding protein